MKGWKIRGGWLSRIAKFPESEEETVTFQPQFFLQLSPEWQSRLLFFDLHSSVLREGRVAIHLLSLRQALFCIPSLASGLRKQSGRSYSHQQGHLVQALSVELG